MDADGEMTHLVGLTRGHPEPANSGASTRIHTFASGGPGSVSKCLHACQAFASSAEASFVPSGKKPFSNVPVGRSGEEGRSGLDLAQNRGRDLNGAMTAVLWVFSAIRNTREWPVGDVSDALSRSVR
jgi:hypothetical protein